MAEHAIGVNCGQCGTLTAVGGKLSDPEFSGQCGTCGAGVSTPNFKYVAPPPAPAEEPEVEAAAPPPAEEPQDAISS